MRTKRYYLIAAAVLALSGFSAAGAATLINGAGSTFGYPIYSTGSTRLRGATVQQPPGAIGHVELTYALTNKISYAQLQNHDGKWVDTTLDGVTAAAAGAAANMPSDFRVSIVDAPGATAYPISSFTWLIVFRNQNDRARGLMLVKFLKLALTDGQSYAASLDYAPLPKEVVSREVSQISAIKIAGGGNDNQLGENN